MHLRARICGTEVSRLHMERNTVFGVVVLVLGFLVLLVPAFLQVVVGLMLILLGLLAIIGRIRLF